MKRLITLAVIVFSFIFSDAFVAYAQNRGGVVSASSMVVTRTRIKKQRNPIKIDWQNNIDVAVCPVSGGHYDVNYSGGWRFGNFLFLGFGTGVQVYPNLIPTDEEELVEAIKDAAENNTFYNPSRIAVPVYAQTKFYFSKKRISPYLSGSGGLLFNGGYYDAVPEGMEGVVYFDVFLGLDVKLKNDSSMTLSMGAIGATHDNYLNPDPDDLAKVMGAFKLTYSFR